jgi:hypothetical protein
MTDAARSERTTRILTARLEELARALARANVPARQAARLLESASVATMHAVTLDLLSSARAEELWRETAERHPAIELPIAHEIERFAA